MISGECLITGAKVSEDAIYKELFKRTDDEELDTLTIECLEMICCSCLVLLNRQLDDQLPGGIYYQPDTEVLQETGLCPKTNVLSERDFAQMDRKVSQKPNISTIAATGTILFLNNKTYGWLRKMPPNLKTKLISKVIRLAPSCIKQYQEKRNEIRIQRVDKQQRIRM